MADDRASTPVDGAQCTIPPEGWRCTREAGHDGPCAAVPTAADPMVAPEVFHDLEWAVARVRRAVEQYPAREDEKPGKGRALLDHAIEALDAAAGGWFEAKHDAVDNDA